MKNPKLYSDRDYLDTQFADIHKKLDKITISLYGNGEKGIVDTVREQGATLVWLIWGTFALFVFLFITHAPQSVEFISNFLKNKL